MRFNQSRWRADRACMRIYVFRDYFFFYRFDLVVALDDLKFQTSRSLADRSSLSKLVYACRPLNALKLIKIENVFKLNLFIRKTELTRFTVSKFSVSNKKFARKFRYQFPFSKFTTDFSYLHDRIKQLTMIMIGHLF